MQFIEPFLLWGALAISIPVVIHFWHQKQGKPLPWAATQWLTEKQHQQSRGLRLDNILLLIIRCLLLTLLAILLAEPILNWFNKPPTIQKVHVVQPSTSVADNFRFELTEATKRGDRVVWADDQLETLTDQPTPTQKSTTFSPLSLQTAINTLDTKNTELHLYVVNSQSLAAIPAITVPVRFQLHTLVDSTSQPRPYLTVKNNKKLFVNQVGKLTSNSALDPALKFQSNPVQAGPITTLLSYKNDRERQTVKAALGALTDVYDLDLTIDEKPIPDRQYNWILTDQLPAKLLPKSLYIISEIEQPAANSNVIFTNESLTPQTSELVENGQLPEWLGEQFIRYYGLKTAQQPLSEQGLKTLFVTSTRPNTQQQAGLTNALLLAFVVLLVFERWLALTKNA